MCYLKISFKNALPLFPVAFLIHSFFLSCSIFSAYFSSPMPFMCINTTRSSHSMEQRKKKRRKKSCRWVIVMVTYTRYTQNILPERPFNTVNVRQCSMICKKFRDCFFFLFSSLLSALALFHSPPDNISSSVPFAKKKEQETQLGLCSSSIFIIFWWYNKNNGREMNTRKIVVNFRWF